MDSAVEATDFFHEDADKGEQFVWVWDNFTLINFSNGKYVTARRYLFESQLWVPTICIPLSVFV